MKTINKYLLEKLIVNNTIQNNELIPEKNKYKDVKIKFYTFDYLENEMDRSSVWKELNFPLAEYVVYNDKYRQNKPHLASFIDMINTIYMFEDDFEDFDPQKDILFYSNNPKEIMIWYIKDFLKLKLPDKYKSVDEWYDSEFTATISHKINDTIYILGEFYNDPDSLRDMRTSYTGYTPDDILKTNPKDIADEIASQFETLF